MEAPNRPLTMREIARKLSGVAAPMAEPPSRCASPKAVDVHDRSANEPLWAVRARETEGVPPERSRRSTSSPQAAREPRSQPATSTSAPRLSASPYRLGRNLLAATAPQAGGRRSSPVPLEQMHGLYAQQYPPTRKLRESTPPTAEEVRSSSYNLTPERLRALERWPRGGPLPSSQAAPKVSERFAPYQAGLDELPLHLPARSPHRNRHFPMAGAGTSGAGGVDGDYDRVDGMAAPATSQWLHGGARAYGGPALSQGTGSLPSLIAGVDHRPLDETPNDTVNYSGVYPQMQRRPRVHGPIAEPQWFAVPQPLPPSHSAVIFEQSTRRYVQHLEDELQFLSDRYNEACALISQLAAGQALEEVAWAEQMARQGIVEAESQAYQELTARDQRWLQWHSVSLRREMTFLEEQQRLAQRQVQRLTEQHQEQQALQQQQALRLAQQQQQQAEKQAEQQLGYRQDAALIASALLEAQQASRQAITTPPPPPPPPPLPPAAQVATVPVERYDDDQRAMVQHFVDITRGIRGLDETASAILRHVEGITLECKAIAADIGSPGPVVASPSTAAVAALSAQLERVTSALEELKHRIGQQQQQQQHQHTPPLPPAVASVVHHPEPAPRPLSTSAATAAHDVMGRLAGAEVQMAGATCFLDALTDKSAYAEKELAHCRTANEKKQASAWASALAERDAELQESRATIEALRAQLSEAHGTPPQVMRPMKVPRPLASPAPETVPPAAVAKTAPLVKPLSAQPLQSSVAEYHRTSSPAGAMDPANAAAERAQQRHAPDAVVQAYYRYAAPFIPDQVRAVTPVKPMSAEKLREDARRVGASPVFSAPPSSGSGGQLDPSSTESGRLRRGEAVPQPQPAATGKMLPRPSTLALSVKKFSMTSPESRSSSSASLAEMKRRGGSSAPGAPSRPSVRIFNGTKPAPATAGAISPPSEPLLATDGTNSSCMAPSDDDGGHGGPGAAAHAPSGRVAKSSAMDVAGDATRVAEAVPKPRHTFDDDDDGSDAGTSLTVDVTLTSSSSATPTHRASQPKAKPSAAAKPQPAPSTGATPATGISSGPALKPPGPQRAPKRRSSFDDDASDATTGDRTTGVTGRAPAPVSSKPRVVAGNAAPRSRAAAPEPSATDAGRVASPWLRKTSVGSNTSTNGLNSSRRGLPDW